MHATLDQFLHSLHGPAAPAGQPPLLQSVWLGLKGEWAQAHGIAQDLSGADAAWVHAWLHRIEGDLVNARYWYRRAARAPHSGDTAAEGQAIAAALLARPVAQP